MKNIRIILWLCTSIIFLILIFNSFKSMHVEYPTFNYQIPSNYNIQIGSVRFQDVINQFTEQFDQHVMILGFNLKRNASIAFWTYIASFTLSCIGLFIELKEGKVTQSKGNRRVTGSDLEM